MCSSPRPSKQTSRPDRTAGGRGTGEGRGVPTPGLSPRAPPTGLLHLGGGLSSWSQVSKREGRSSATDNGRTASASARWLGLPFGHRSAMRTITASAADSVKRSTPELGVLLVECMGRTDTRSRPDQPRNRTGPGQFGQAPDRSRSETGHVPSKAGACPLACRRDGDAQATLKGSPSVWPGLPLA